MRTWTLPCAGRAREGLHRAAHDSQTNHTKRLQLHDKRTIETQQKMAFSATETSSDFPSRVQSYALDMLIEH